ncbi:sulfurtransferase TusA family protein [Pelotomaculum terephthalicicum JT]|nr:sulfurtransferase TusA family protein [Pelotomaculum sp. PtaB.Bin117]MCG9966802.1 sulfurtransferase TusA family protein [Pelotomaculum terephthalicicum JT]
MAEIKDARGLACPEPVLMVKNEIDKIGGGTIKVLVNTVAAKENISRLAGNQKWSVSIAEEGDGWLITLTK